METVMAWLLPLGELLTKLSLHLRPYVYISPGALKVVLVVAVVAPLTIAVIVKLALMWLRRTAKHAMLQVKKMKEVLNQGHFLDLDPAFVEKMSANDKYCRVTSLATYLNSLDYGNDDNVAYRIMTTLVSSVAGESMMPLLPLIPASMIPKSHALSTSSLIARFTMTEFPSILTMAAAVDTATQISAQMPGQGNVALPKGTMDAMDLLYRGEKAGIEPDLPVSVLLGKPIVFSSASTLQSLVSSEMDLGPEPDSKHYAFPKPFSPDLLPGLCLGNGGLEMSTTPRQQASNRVLSAVMNKLCTNFMAWGGYGPFCEPEELYKEFSVFVGDDEASASTPIYTCGQFMQQLVEKGGGHMEAYLRTNTTAFGIGLCVLDEETEKKNTSAEEIKSTDGSKRFKYTQIPLAFCTRTGVTCPVSGSSVHQLSTHSGIEWHFFDNKFLGPGEVVVTFYTGVEGFTGFKPGGEWLRPWVVESDQIRSLSYEEAIRAADLSACEAVCSNVCVRVWKFPFGGYGGLGVCADSVAAVEYALRGRTTIFPLLMRGDAKTGLLYVVHDHVRTRLADVLEKGQFAQNDSRSRLIKEFLELMNVFARALIRLPNDIQVEPHEISDSLDRINTSIMRSPFYADQFEVSRLRTIKEGWTKALKDFETDFAEVAGLLYPKRETIEISKQ